MIEDKLNQAQRLRLECLNQAVSSNVVLVRGETTETLIIKAKRFETYIVEGKA